MDEKIAAAPRRRWPGPLAAGWVLAAGALGFVVLFEGADESPWAAAPPLAAILVVGAAWFRRSRSGESRSRFPIHRVRSMQLAWLVVLLAGLGVNGGALGLVTGTFAGDMTTVHVRYEAVVTPQEPGPIEVILPAMSRPLGVRVVPGDAIAERVETEHGMGWRITSEGPVHLETSMKKRIDADDLVAYHPTMTTSNESNPAWDPDKEYWIYVGGAAPVNVTMRMDVGDPCGTYQNRLNTTASHGWYTYQGQFAHPHGDLCFSPLEMVLLVLTFPFVGLSFMLAPLGAVFLMGLPAVTVAEAWLKLCPASSR